MSGKESEPMRTALFPLREAVISARIDSVMQPINRKCGDSFKKGEPLLLLDDTRYQIEISRSREMKEFTRNVYQNKLELRRKNFTSDFELKKAEHDYNLSLTNLNDAELNLSFCRITAPFDGKIAEIITKEYETVRPGQPLIRIIDDHYLLATVNLPLKTYQSKLRIGTTAVLKLDCGEIVNGTFHEISPTADNRTGTVRVRILVDNRKGHLRAGMTGDLLYVN